jgi:hypothetical protein
MPWLFLKKKKPMKHKWSQVFLLSLFVGGILSLFASSSPDGLERVAQVAGFLEQGEGLSVAALPDYMMPGIHEERVAVSLAGILGTGVVFLTLLFLGKYLYASPGKKKSESVS